jgi:hypothetical protein
MTRLLLAFSALALLVVAGCGPVGGRNPGPAPSGANVSGKVTYRNATLGGGTVNMVSESDPTKTAQGAIDVNGNYTVKDAPVGRVIVTVETLSARQFDPAHTKGSAPAGAAIPTMKYVPIPTAYNSPTKSGLRYTVTAGDQTHNIALK